MNIYLRIFIISSTVIIMLLSITKSIRLVQNNGCTDLRCRIVGSRLSQAGLSPYFYKWKSGDSSCFLDPNDKPGRKVNGNVVTPAVLKIISPLAGLQYPAIKYVWLTLQYIFFLSSLFLLAGFNKNNIERSWIWLSFVIVVFCYAGSNILLYNIERGQIYSLYLFIFSLIYAFYQSSWKYGIFAAGFINGISVYFRPLLLVFTIPFVLKKDRQWITGAFCGAILGALLFVLPFVHEWKDYFSAMKEYSLEITMKQPPAGIQQAMPATIEGDSTMRLAVPFVCSGLYTVQYYFAFKKISLQSFTLAGIYCVLAALLCFLYSRINPSSQTTNNIFLFAFLLYMLAELFIIGQRGGYNLVEWIFAIFIIFNTSGLSKYLLISIPVALLLLNNKTGFIPHQFEIAELILFVVLFYAVVARNSGLKNTKEA